MLVLIYLQLGDEFLETFYRKTFGKPASAAILRFCRREVIQEIIALLMDKDLMDKYVNGLVTQWADGIFRRGFIRFVIHSADYPEK